MKQIKVKLIGSKKDGYILSIENEEEDFYQDVALKYEELVEIKKVLDKKIK